MTLYILLGTLFQKAKQQLIGDSNLPQGVGLARVQCVAIRRSIVRTNALQPQNA